ncbi:hypothetical protein [Maribacter forsetii]|uniref:hypothetical protein n=1 Tax=Maribacter forsetii TaxID=444515 RepID=UPI00068BD067|nr:hypothetical protein [Maribacter forsetii]
MLKIGGYINFLIAFSHIVGLIWAEQMFKITGIGKEMIELAQINSSFPYLLTIFVSIMFTIFGLYGLSADDKFKKLPFSNLGVFLIAGIYIFRGVGELIFDMWRHEVCTISKTVYSLISIAIGVLFLCGGLKKWKPTKGITNAQSNRRS